MTVVSLLFFLFVVFSNIPFCRPGKVSDACGKQPADILFIVDNSGSVGETDFNICLHFILQFSDYFDIGNDHVKISVFTAEGTFYGFYLNESTNRDELKRLIRSVNQVSIPYIPNGFEDAFLHAKNKVFQEFSGARDFAHKIIVAMTDGQISVYDAPKILKDDDVVIFGIGVTNDVNEGIINFIATSKDHVYVVNDFSLITGITVSLINTSCNEMLKNPCDKCVNATQCVWTGLANYTCVCAPGFTGKHCHIDIDDCQNVTCQNGGTCKDKINAFTCICPPLYSGIYCEIDLCTQQPVDIVFLMDGSYSVDTANFEQQKRFIKQVLRNLTIGPDDVQVGAVMFSTNANVIFNLKQYTDVRQIETAIDTASFTNGASFLGKAFQTAENMLNAESRSRSKKFILLLFDGMMSDPREAKIKADKLISQYGAEIFVIAFGSDFYHDKAVTISGGVEQNVFVNNQPDRFFNRLVFERSYAECYDCKYTNNTDMVFLVDCSSDVRELHFTNTIPAKLREIISSLPIGPDNVQYALITYHVTAEVKFNLTSFDQSDLESIYSYVSRFTRSKDRGNLSLGLTEAFSQFQSFNIKNRKKQLVVVSTFKSTPNNQVKNILAKLAANGVEIITIALDCVDELSCQCKQIATSAGFTYYFGDNFNDSLDTLISNMQETSCTKR